MSDTTESVKEVLQQYSVNVVYLKPDTDLESITPKTVVSFDKSEEFTQACPTCWLVASLARSIVSKDHLVLEIEDIIGEKSFGSGNVCLIVRLPSSAPLGSSVLPMPEDTVSLWSCGTIRVNFCTDTNGDDLLRLTKEKQNSARVWRLFAGVYVLAFAVE